METRSSSREDGAVTNKGLLREDVVTGSSKLLAAVTYTTDVLTIARDRVCLRVNWAVSVKTVVSSTQNPEHLASEIEVWL